MSNQLKPIKDDWTYRLWRVRLWLLTKLANLMERIKK